MHNIYSTLYTRGGTEVQIRRNHNYYTIWHGQRKVNGASSRNQSDAVRMAHHVIEQLNAY